MTDCPRFDPLDPEVLADPFPAYAEARSGCPVAHVDADAPYFIFFRHEDVRGAIMDQATWTSRYGTSPIFQRSIGVFSDGPPHTDFRNIFKSRLLPRALIKLEDQIRRLASDQLDEMLAKGSPGELHDDFALPLPVKVISLLLGIPGEQYVTLKAWSDALMENGFGQDNEAFLKAYEGVCAFFDGHLEARYAVLAAAGIEEPGPEHLGTVLTEDWISDAVCAVFQGRRLTRAEQHLMLMGLLVGGNETTTSLITNLMWRLLETPALWDRLCADPETLIPTAIEESLRRDPPTLGMWRTSLCPVSAHGVEIPAKSKLMLAFGAANHDPEVFPDPETFSLDRSRAELMQHIAFGVGPHNCPGAPLSRLEAKIVLELFVERLDRPRLAGANERLGAFNFWGRKKLPMTWG